MAEYTRNNGKHWTPEEISYLKDLAKQNTPTRVIGMKLKRSLNAISSKASEKKISLQPTNQSPYNRRKKL